jgi:hypothetical protein
MPEISMNPHGLRRHSTSLVYAKGSGHVLHVSHIEVMEGSTPPPELLSQIELGAVDEACRIHGVARDRLAVVSLDPKEFKPDVIYSVDLATGTLTTKPIGGTRRSSPRM